MNEESANHGFPGARIRARLRRSVATLLAAIVAGSPSGAFAAGTVSGNTTEALLKALAGGGTVRIEATNPIVLDLPVVISQDTVIEGAAVSGRTVTISGGGEFRIFHVLSGVRFEVRGITLREGVSTNGGAILNDGILVADNVVFTACEAGGAAGTNGVDGGVRYGFGQDGTSASSGQAASGGAVVNRGEALFTKCSFLVNEASGGDGGEGGDGGAGTTKSGYGGYGGHGGEGHGGAILNLGTATVTNCVFSGNVARGGKGGAGGAGKGALGSGQGGTGASSAGGAIHNLGSLLIAASSFTTNLVIAGASADGGAPSVVAGEPGAPGGTGYGGAVSTWSTCAVVNSTFYTNLVSGGAGGKGVAGSAVAGPGGRGGDAWGGALHVRGHLGMTNVTVALNAAGGGVGGAGGGGLSGANGAAGTPRGAGLAADAGAVVQVINSIFVTDPDLGLPGLHGPFLDLGHNLFNDAGPSVLGPASRRDVDPLLSAFGIWTLGPPGFLPTAGSPAIDAANDDAAPPLDQRGVIRGTGRGPEIGALEADALSSGFIMAGHVYAGTTGSNGMAGVVVHVGTHSVVTDASGRFQFRPLPSGAYSVELANGGLGFTPRLIQLVLAADRSDLDFRPAAPRLVVAWDAVASRFAIEATGGVPGRAQHLESSPDLIAWQAAGSLTADAQGRVRFLVEPGPTPERYYRVRSDLP